MIVLRLPFQSPMIIHKHNHDNQVIQAATQAITIQDTGTQTKAG